MRILKEIEKLFFYFLLFLIPVQSRFILFKWQEPFNEWTSAFLHGTDILLGIILILWAVRWLADKERKMTVGFWRWDNPDLWLISFLALAGVSISVSMIKGLSFYQFLKLCEFACFYFYIKNTYKLFSFRSMLAVVIISGFIQALIGTVQFLKQGSLGLRLLGESPIIAGAPGVASFFVDSQLYLRAYGTTPHPNILAGWLLVSIFAFYFWYLRRNQRRELYWSLLIYAVILIGFFYTFSRVFIFLWLLGSAISFALVLFKAGFRQFWKKINCRVLVLAAVTVAVILSFSLVHWRLVNSRLKISSSDEAVYQRVFYARVAGLVAKSKPVLGIGLGQFVPELSVKFKHLPSTARQPVHNFYLLIINETGIVGITIFGLFLVTSLRGLFKGDAPSRFYRFSFLILAASFLLDGIFDHFLWTIQQGRFILWLILALVATVPAVKDGFFDI